MKSSHVIQKVIEELKKDPAIKKADDDRVIMEELCKKIQTEEDAKLDVEIRNYMKDHGPRGVAVLLTLHIPYQRNPKEFSYITLEYDALAGWSVCYYIDFGKTNQYKLKKRHDIKAENPNHIMTEFAKILKTYLRK
jgi:hypothetical protein